MGGRSRSSRVFACAVALLALVAIAAPASAAPSQKKAIWGPVERDGVSQFPIYDELGVGIYQTAISWRQVAPTRPVNPDDPSDPAYNWPSEIDQAVSEGQRYGIRVMVAVSQAPRWANGGHGATDAPKKASEFARFAAAGARRYPGVHLWLIWGEPSKRGTFKPLATVVTGRHITPSQRVGPRRYAEILD